ncbi:response regulator transcription factor [Streptomyces monashensis]|uniref:response regulator transcription factor n=1 Tax=Streptomyces monashensis TaxID=1678012 RepID=UPI0009A108E2
MLSAEPDREVVGDAASGARAEALAAEPRPDIVLMDLRMPDRSGAEPLVRWWPTGRRRRSARCGTACWSSEARGAPEISPAPLSPFD